MCYLLHMKSVAGTHYFLFLKSKIKKKRLYRFSFVLSLEPSQSSMTAFFSKNGKRTLGITCVKKQWYSFRGKKQVMRTMLSPQSKFIIMSFVVYVNKRVHKQNKYNATLKWSTESSWPLSPNQPHRVLQTQGIHSPFYPRLCLKAFWITVNFEKIFSF